MRLSRFLCYFFMILLIMSFTAGVYAEQVTITYWRHDYDPAIKLDQELIAIFEAEHPNIDVKLLNLDGTPSLNQKLIVAFVGGGAPDVFNLSSEYFAQYVHAGFISPVDLEVFGAMSHDELAKGWWAGSLDGWKYQDQYYGIPTELSTYGMMVNRDHFRDAGLDPDKDHPLTWVEGDRSMVAVAKKLTRMNQGIIVREGWALPTDGEGGPFLLDTLIKQRGGSTIGPNGKTSPINQEPGLTSLSMLYDMIHKYKVTAPSGTGSQASRYPDFGNGDASIIVNVGSWYRGYLADGYPDVYKGGEGAAFYPVPRFADGLDVAPVNQGYALQVSSRSKHPKEAWEFVRFLTSYPEKYLESMGLMQPKTGLLETDAAKSFPDMQMWVEELSSGGFFEGGAGMAKVLQRAVTRSLYDKVDPERSLALAKEEIEEYLGSLPYSVK